jgi:hypothetical protein
MSAPAALKAVQGRNTGYQFIKHTVNNIANGRIARNLRTVQEINGGITCAGRTITTTLSQRLSVNEKYIRRKITPIGKYRIGSQVEKKSKYNSSTTYFCPISPKGQRSILSDRYSKTKLQNHHTEEHLNERNNWILCARNFAPKSRRRRINPISPTSKHDKVEPAESRRWQTAILSSFKPKIKNYYQPLYDFTHHEEQDMARDKVQAATAMRVRMGRIRSGTSGSAPNPNAAGRGGGRTAGGYGRGDGEASTTSRTSINKRENIDRKEISNETTITTTSMQSEDTPSFQHEETISDLTNQTIEQNMEMEEDEDQLAPVMTHGIPSSIEKFTPNVQWNKDIAKDLTKNRYGIEVKISPPKTTSANQPAPRYNHIRIFKALATSLLTAAPGTGICSINEDEEMIINTDDIPTSQSKVDYYLDSPTTNPRT